MGLVDSANALGQTNDIFDSPITVGSPGLTRKMHLDVELLRRLRLALPRLVEIQLASRRGHRPPGL